MAGLRTALLIGVAATPQAAHHFEELTEPVEADRRTLGAALRAADYEVHTVANATRAELTTTIHEVSRRIPADGTLLVHFSGHGIRIGDTDYLIPSDARAPQDDDWTRPYLDTLVPADISRYLSECRAETVLWLVDACRADSGSREAFGSSILKGHPSGRFAVMTACDVGQRAGYSAQGSFFTLALAEALGPLTEARTVHEVYEAAKAQTWRTSAKAGEKQEVQIRYGNELQAEARSTVVCPGRRLLEAWREAVLDTPLWDRVSPPASSEVPRLRESLVALAEQCADVVHLAQERLPDPWADDDFPVRLLRDRLPRLLSPAVALSPLEATALVAAPFLHEAAWARRLSHAEDIGPYRVSHQEDGDHWRRHYEQVADHHPHIAGKVSACLLGGRYEEARSVSLWLVHRWIAERSETDEEPVPDIEAARLAAALLGAGTEGGDRAAELSGLLRTVATGISLGPPAEEESERAAARVAMPGGHQEFRAAELAGLLRLAALLAFDVRTLPEVVAEHLAVSDPVLPQDVVNAVRAADWDEQEGDLHLDVVCRHPAIHAAFAGVVEEADELACALRESAQRRPAGRAALLTAVPGRVTDRRLRPAQDSGHRAYDVPLLRFQLAQTEVRDLLMGERLYDGEPELALRELYQNAMDACRYRSMRLRYLAIGGSRSDWTGQISIVEGEDELGRYVECRDNGVGMGLDQLRNTFTRAGRRFEQSRSFRQEQANWLRHDPSLRLYPNSRFGIGVFSYFMLADQMTVVTRAVNTEGVPAAKALRVDISGSGNLFRVRELSDTSEENLLEGGTRIRLYLRASIARTALSPVETLRRLVRTTECRLVVRDASGREQRWNPGELQESGGPADAVEGVPGVLWWVPGKGAILCDGIATDRRPFGYVLNLTGPHAGELSVNRKKLRSYDRAWERQQWQSGSTALAAWEKLDTAWLWQLEEQNLSAAQEIWKVWRGRGVRARRNSWQEPVDLDTLGWFHLDSKIDYRKPGGHRQERQAYIWPWRAALLDDGYLAERAGAPLSPVGHPKPQPGWANIALAEPGGWRTSSLTPPPPRDWRTVVALAYGQSTTVQEVMGAMRAMRIAHPELNPPRAKVGDLDWAPDIYDSVIVNGLIGADVEAPRWDTKRENNYRHGPDDLGGLVRASATAHLSLGKLVESCARYRPFLFAPLPTVPPHHRDHVCDAQDLGVLYVDDGPGTDGWRRTRRPWDILRTADRLSLGPQEVLERLESFSWLGWRAPDAESVARWSRLPHEIRTLFEHHCLPDASGRLTVPWAACVALAAEWETTLRKAEKEIARWAGFLGLEHIRRHRGKTEADRLVPDPATGAVVSVARAVGLRLEDGLTLRDLAFCRPNDVEWPDLALVVDDLRQAGADVPDAARLIHAWETLPEPSKYVFSGQDPHFEGADYPLPPTSDILFAASIQLKSPLRTAWKTARREAKRVGMAVPALPTPLADFRPDWKEGRALLDWPREETDGEWFEPPRWAALTPGRLVEYARELHLDPQAAYQRLSALRELGAPVPELTPAEVAGLPTTKADARDVVALGDEHRVSPQGHPLCPLDLVSLAGRLGEGADRTWRRIVPYLPLEPKTSVQQVPDVLPLWQDLIALSVHADGLLPALHGEVSTDQISFAADAVGESEEWVRDRLGRYAAMFELRLEDPDDD
ncbi:HD domain-containing protein [Streptomyces melanogenes]|uniref:HD domain-containing protein n=1 Tax=Streptomyces melanogenes TaxID=67326 RepID=UPI0037A89A50